MLTYDVTLHFLRNGRNAFESAYCDNKAEMYRAIAGGLSRGAVGWYVIVRRDGARVGRIEESFDVS